MSEERFAERDGGIRLCYRVDGPDDGVPVLLIAGLGIELTSWPARLVDGLTRQHLKVIRMDNRDAGRSTKVATAPPGRLRQLFARPRADAYSLADMADDAVAVIEATTREPVHVVGMSLGGMVAQTLAARHPERVVTLTSIFSTTGDRRVGRTAASTIVRLARPPARTVEESVARHLALLGHIGSAAFPPDEELERAWAAGAWERAGGRRGGAPVARQISAIHASGDRTADLRRIAVPTLVIHGDTDRMVHPSGGRATAAAIPGARHVEIAGMGHHLAPGVIDRIVELTAGVVMSSRR